jgi:hypothetical protein
MRRAYRISAKYNVCYVNQYFVIASLRSGWTETQWFLYSPPPTGLMSISYSLYFLDSPDLEGQVPVFIFPQEQGGPARPLGIRITFKFFTIVTYVFLRNNEGEEDEMGGACSTNGGKRNACRLLVGKPEGRKPLGRPIRRWLDNIRMDLVEVGWGDVGWIGLARDRGRWRALVNSVLNFRAP